MKKPRNQAQILGVSLSGTSRPQVLARITDHLKNGTKFLIVTPNPEIIVHAQTNLKLRTILNRADLSVPDGVGLILASKLLNQPKLTLIKGRELLIDLFKLANDHHLKVFLLGSTESVINLSINRLIDTYPNIEVQGTSGPMLDKNSLPVSDKDTTLQFDTIKQINHFLPDILILAFGTPKQEVWYDLNKDQLKVKVVAGLGGSLDYYSGIKFLPPKLINSLGLEWLWRGIHEKGHGRRIFRATIIFPFLVLKSIFVVKN